jgi:ankyrin repeat protein
VNVQDGFGDTALIAASRGGFAEVCQTLLKAGADARLRNTGRATADDVARLRGFDRVQKILATS